METRSQRFRRINKRRYEYQNLRAHAKSRRLTFSLTYGKFLELYSDRCPVFNFKMKANKMTALKNSRTFDRIDSSKGYSDKNVQCMSHLANTVKGNLTAEQQIQVALFFLKTNTECPLDTLIPYLPHPEKYSHILRQKKETANEEAIAMYEQEDLG